MTDRSIQRTNLLKAALPLLDTCGFPVIQMTETAALRSPGGRTFPVNAVSKQRGLSGQVE